MVLRHRILQAGMLAWLCYYAATSLMPSQGGWAAPPSPSTGLRGSDPDQEGVSAAVADPHPLRAGKTMPGNPVSRKLVELAATHAGVFVNKTHRPALKHTVLVTAGEWRSRTLFFNWVCFAKQFGLDYMVLADTKLHSFLGDARAVPYDGTAHISDAWGKSAQEDVGCKKLEAVHRLLNNGYSVLYAEPWHVTGRLPRQLLRDISGGKFDALIHTDDPTCNVRRNCPLKLKTGKFASSGLSYWSAQRPGTAKVLARAVKLCRQKPRTPECCTGQQALNQVLWELQARPKAGAVAKKGTPLPFNGMEFCRFNRPAKVQMKSKNLQLCIIDPKTHLAAKHPHHHHKTAAGQLEQQRRQQQVVERLMKNGLWQLGEGDTCTDADVKNLK